MLDAFANGLIENTNNIYAQSATSRMDSKRVNFNNDTPLLNTDENFKEGSFDLVVYDINGNEVAKRSIDLGVSTKIGGSSDTTSIIGQIKSNKDDNSDGSAINDIDDFIEPIFHNPTGTDAKDASLSFSLKPDFEAQGYTFSLVDSSSNPTNFAGAMGMHRFFDGSDAKNIELNRSLANDTSKISASKVPVAGDNQVASAMVSMQFNDLDFYDGEDKYTDSIYGFYDSIATKVGTTTNAEVIRNDSINAQYNAISLEYDSISKVSIDEELTNLIRYQTAYGAASKIITTVDQMMQTLLGIKQ
jgi:flagellar hook-associated protein 1 FlgK